MTMTDTPSDPKSAGEIRSAAAAEPTTIVLTFEDRLQIFWRRNSSAVIAGCAIVLVAIVGAGVWDYLAKQKELDVQKDYAAAITPEALKTFADANAGHALAGAAYLRIADDAFASGKTADAMANYEKVRSVFKDGPLAARAQLGLSMAKLAGDKAVAGAAELKQIAEDANQFKGLRAEAAYNLASLAAESGASADVMKYSVLLMQIDPSSPWTQRAMALQGSLPPPAADVKIDAAPSGPPAIQVGPATK